jgi:ftsJ-like methyltransferase
MIPQAFQQQMCALLGDAEAGALCTALSSGNTPTSIRTNPFKPLKDGECLFAPVDNGESSSDIAAPLTLRPVPWCESGVYLAERPTFAHDPLWHAGAYYVQEAASMFIAQAYKVIETTHADEATKGNPLKMLDLCAAPGGKSTLWRSLLPDDALLVANEPIRQRAQILAENLTKWGHPHTFVTQAFPDAFTSLEETFDIIATDVPCSGEGMFRKDEQAREEWSLAAVISCAERQRDILTAVWPALKEGGFCVYSTCTFNREENEDLVAWACDTLGAELVEIPTDVAWHISGDTTGRNLPVYHFFPHRTEGEGLFLALLRKKTQDVGESLLGGDTFLSSKWEKTQGSRAAKGKKRGNTPSAKPNATLLSWLPNAEDFTFQCSEAGVWTAVPTAFVGIREQLAQVAPLLIGGIEIAEEKGKKLVPQHALAMSISASNSAFPRVEISRELALAYLHREAITLPPEAPRGYVVLTYRGIALGFANNLGNRANNLYPNEWRLRNL